MDIVLNITFYLHTKSITSFVLSHFILEVRFLNDRSIWLSKHDGCCN